MAAAMRASQQPADPVAVVRRMSRQMILARDRSSQMAKRAIEALWRAVDPFDDAQVRRFAAQAAKIMAAAQAASARAAAAGQAQQLAALGIRVQAIPSNPVDVRAAGATISGGKIRLQHRSVTVDYDGGPDTKIRPAQMTTQAVFQRPAMVYRYEASKSSPAAEQRSNQRIENLVDSNLLLAQRLAQQEVLANAVDLDRKGPRIVGYRRVIHPELSKSGTCGMCIAASDRVYKVSELLPIHDHCHCTIAPVTEDHDPGGALNGLDLKQLYEHAGGNTVAHLKRTRYTIDEHGELGPVLVPDKPYKPRSEQSRRITGAAKSTAKQVESPDDVGRRNLPAFQRHLERLRANGVPEDSPKIAYLQNMINKFVGTTGGDASSGWPGSRRAMHGAKNSEQSSAAGSKQVGAGRGAEHPSASGGDRPPTKPPSGGQSVQGADEPRRGKVDRTAVRNLRQHELDTAQRLADLGDNVRFIAADAAGKAPDVEISGQRWEIKSPTSSNRNTLITRLGRGAMQSGYVIFDISRTSISVNDAISVAREALQRYAGLSVVRIIGRDIAGGPLDIRIGR
ncbi:hypothetical protein [Mycobacterium heckeshornense]|uniref:CdiA C-terminal domain-containing protein n=1 Tax=Mycobacterium heckeshornense TaxID=110505 RepID=UPI0006625420|nr:hypothetical protein [Mycobacterium heckeshornense]